MLSHPVAIHGNLVLGSCSDWKDLSGGPWPCWASPQVWFTVLTSIDTVEEPSSQGSISPRVELSCLRCYYTVCKECAECWGGPFIARVFEDVILHQPKLSGGCLLWCHPLPLLCSPAALVLVLMSQACLQLKLSTFAKALSMSNTRVEAAWMGALFVGCPNLSEICRRFGCWTSWDLEFTWGFS